MQITYSWRSKFRLSMGLVLLGSLVALNEPNAAETELAALPNFVQLAEKLEPVVVNISTTQAAKPAQSSPQ